MLGVRRMEIALTVRTVDGRETVVATTIEFDPAVVLKDVKMKYSDDALYDLIHGLMHNLGIDGAKINELVDLYMRENYQDGDTERSRNTRNTFKKDLNSKPQSWKFLIRALLIFRVAIFDFDVRLTHNLKSIQSAHGRKIAIDQNYNP